MTLNPKTPQDQVSISGSKRNQQQNPVVLHDDIGPILLYLPPLAAKEASRQRIQHLSPANEQLLERARAVLSRFQSPHQTQ